MSLLTWSVRVAKLLGVAALGLSRAHAQEAEAPSSLRIDGFGTLGLTHAQISQPWGFRRDASQTFNSGGTRLDTDSRLGLQVDYAVSPTLELGGQLQLRRRASASNPEESLEWAFAAWRATSDLTIRVGRTSPDLFLLSDYRSVGFAYPWVRPNVDTYGALPIFSIDGADVAQVWTDGDVRWRAKGFAGVGHTRLATGSTGDVEFTIDSMYGLTLSREKGGLLLRATVARGRGGLGTVAGIADLRSALAAAQSLPDAQVAAQARQLEGQLDASSAYFTYLGAGVSFEHERWLFSAELVRVSSPLSYAASRVGYVSIGRRFGPVTAYGMLGAARSTRRPVDAPQWEAELTPLVGAPAAAQFQAAGAAAAQTVSYLVAQRSGSLGLRWDLHPQMALKLQWDRILVDADGGVLWGQRGRAAASANIGSMALDFVF